MTGAAGIDGALTQAMIVPTLERILPRGRSTFVVVPLKARALPVRPGTQEAPVTVPFMAWSMSSQATDPLASSRR